MKTTVMKPVEVEIAAVRIVVGLSHGDDDMPYDYPFRSGDTWSVTVDADTGQIRDWPGGHAMSLYSKICDCGSYYLLGAKGEVIASIEDNYVPHGVVPGDYGDYISLTISDAGRIVNWPKTLDLDAFFPVGE